VNNLSKNSTLDDVQTHHALEL